MTFKKLVIVKAKKQYVKTSNNISLSMKVLNHGSQATILSYLGLERETMDNDINDIDAFDVEI